MSAYTYWQQLPRSVAVDAIEEISMPWTAELSRCFLQKYSYSQIVLRSLPQIETDEACDYHYRMDIARYYSIMGLWSCLWSADQRNDSLDSQPSLPEGGLNCVP
jgi:hypothetical protein